MNIKIKELLICFTTLIFTLNIFGCKTDEILDEKISLGDTIIKVTETEVSEVIDEPMVYVNQAGYLIGKEKYFITNKLATNFDILNYETEEVLFSGEVVLKVEDDRSTGKTTYIGDFTGLDTDGIYKIITNNNLESYPFSIGSDVFNDVAKKSILSFYYQRCGTALEEQFAGEFSRDICHVNDSIYHPSTGLAGTKPSVGGWHDAGDYGKYINSAAVSLAPMLIAYEQWPEKFNFDDNGIPESGNGISDFLDEVKYELDWFLTMQNTDSSDEMYGAVHYMINTKDYVWFPAELDDSERFIYNYSSVATANLAAVLASAYRIFKDIPLYSDWADKYLEAAIAAWSFLEKNPDLYPVGGFARPDDTLTGGYAESADAYDSDDRLWAAVELFITTGEVKYNNFALENRALNSVKSFNRIPDWADTTSLGKYQYMVNTVDSTDLTVQENLKKFFIKNSDNIIGEINKDGFNDALTRYYWGANGGVMLIAHYLITTYELTGDIKYYNAALAQLNYLLGVNAHNISFVTKVGSDYPKNIHHAALAKDDSDDIYPGMVPGGPNGSINGDYTLPEYFTRSTPDALCYIDHVDSWASNENCLLYNAPLVGVAAYFSDIK